jgi:hypothetical protein
MKSLLALVLLAAPAAAREGEAWKWQFTGRYSGTGGKAATEGGADRGALRTHAAEYDLRRRVLSSGRFNATVGAGFERVSLRHDSRAPLPDHLQSVTALISGGFVFDRRSWLTATLTPGFYGDDELLAQDFNVAGALAFHHLYRTDLHLIAGLAVDPTRSSPALPFVGALWRATERWNFRLMPPHLRVEYRAYWTPEAAVDLFGGLSISGGQYRVSKELGRRVGRPEIGGQILSIATQQVLGGVRAAGGGVEGELFAGWAYFRRIRYARPGITLESDGVPTLGASLTGRF